MIVHTMSTKEIDHDLTGVGENEDDKDIQDPIELALHGKKFTKISLDEIEQVSIHEQSRYTGNSS